MILKTPGVVNHDLKGATELRSPARMFSEPVSERLKETARHRPITCMRQAST
jgi:hypothetical protein